MTTKIYVNVTEEKNWTYAIRLQIFECILAFCKILATQQYTKMSEVHIHTHVHSEARDG